MQRAPKATRATDGADVLVPLRLAARVRRAVARVGRPACVRGTEDAAAPPHGRAAAAVPMDVTVSEAEARGAMPAAGSATAPPRAKAGG